MEELRGAPWAASGNAEPGPDGRKGVSLCLKGDANMSILHFKKMLLLNRKKQEEGKGGFQGKFRQAAPDRAGPARQGSFVQGWELSVFLSTQGTAPSPSSQAPCGVQFFACNIQPLSSCQMIHCRPAELICTETSQFWTVSHHLPQRGSHSK